MLGKLFRVVDQTLLELYTSLARPFFVSAETERLEHSPQISPKLKERRQEYTRQFWRDLSLKYGANVLMSCTKPTLDVLEEAMSLDVGSRPAWVKASSAVPAKGELYFLRCACICHEPGSLMTPGVTGNRVLLTNGKWCCECSAYEDI